MTKFDLVKEFLESADDITLFNIYNQYVKKNNYYDDQVYDMDEFDEICYGMTPTCIAQSVLCGDFNANDHYFTFNGYGNFNSHYTVLDAINSTVRLDDVVDYIVDNEESFGYEELDEIFEEDEDEDKN